MFIIFIAIISYLANADLTGVLRGFVFRTVQNLHCFYKHKANLTGYLTFPSVALKQMHSSLHSITARYTEDKTKWLLSQHEGLYQHMPM